MRMTTLWKPLDYLSRRLSARFPIFFPPPFPSLSPFPLLTRALDILATGIALARDGVELGAHDVHTLVVGLVVLTAGEVLELGVAALQPEGLVFGTHAGREIVVSCFVFFSFSFWDMVCECDFDISFLGGQLLFSLSFYCYPFHQVQSTYPPYIQYLPNYSPFRSSHSYTLLIIAIFPPFSPLFKGVCVKVLVPSFTHWSPNQLWVRSNRRHFCTHADVYSEKWIPSWCFFGSLSYI